MGPQEIVGLHRTKERGERVISITYTHTHIYIQTFKEEIPFSEERRKKIGQRGKKKTCDILLLLLLLLTQLIENFIFPVVAFNRDIHSLSLLTHNHSPFLSRHTLLYLLLSCHFQPLVLEKVLIHSIKNDSCVYFPSRCVSCSSFVPCK